VLLNFSCVPAHDVQVCVPISMKSPVPVRSSYAVTVTVSPALSVTFTLNVLCTPQPSLFMSMVPFARVGDDFILIAFSVKLVPLLWKFLNPIVVML